MKPGDVVMTTSIEVRTEVVKPGMRANFKSNKGTAMVFLACGSVAQGENPIQQVRRVLEAIGWTQEPACIGKDSGIANAFSTGATP